MVRNTLIATLVFISLAFNTGEIEIRSKFHKIMFSEDDLEVFVEQNKTTMEPLSLGYVGLAETMLAEHAFLPNSKLNYFNKGKEKIEKSIKLSNKSAELRYIRLLIQLNAPDFLGYNKRIEEDVNLFIASSKNQISKVWLTKFTDNLIGAEYINDVQKKKLQAFKKSL